MKQFYQIRNEIIHAGRDYVEEDVGQVEYGCRALILTLLDHTKGYQNIIELIDGKFPINVNKIT
jgi:hypothetical protein